MSDSPSSRLHLSSTYFVSNLSNTEELQRVQVQDQMVTAAMGGVLPEQADPTRFQRVLDVGCGAGAWVIEAARTYPHMILLIGVDISTMMLDYAREQAVLQHLNDRVEFHQMDALRMLEFPTGYFDLVNQRCAKSWIRTWDWPKLLQEFQRVTRPGGVIRVTEPGLLESNSPALNRHWDFLMHAFYQSGRLFTEEHDGLIKDLACLLGRYGLQQVQKRAYRLQYRAGTPEGQHFVNDVQMSFRTLMPFLRKWAHLPNDYEEIYKQAVREIQQPDFEATWHLLTAWGIKES